ncbi:MAG: bifunctional 5,10-methylenetetrahydrofolate dehydrogenase/5,10-methenyltetrahydrofolate cyclohydrolase [bacterium]|nr:bifunctional 5,10-methylenetetrahydrofolate dehydrogenase/5,10-methenyltetrahydrofolate cyclohydrolase [bacterium]
MVIDGTAFAHIIKNDIREQLARRSGTKITPGLGIVLVGSDDASVVYVGIKEKVAKSLGFHTQIQRLPATAKEIDIKKVIEEMNRDKKIHGILVQIPLPKHIDYQEVLNTIAIEKDIDCLSHASLGALLKGETFIAPPTAEAVLLLIEHAGMTVPCADIAVVGAGFFGRQIAFHLLNHGASVSVVQDMTKDISQYTKKADVVVSVVGKAGLITGAIIKKDAVFIDVGVSVIDGKVVGDADEMSIAHKASAYTPVPGGVGPVTVACVMKNVMERVWKIKKIAWCDL